MRLPGLDESAPIRPPRTTGCGLASLHVSSRAALCEKAAELARHAGRRDIFLGLEDLYRRDGGTLMFALPVLLRRGEVWAFIACCSPTPKPGQQRGELPISGISSCAGRTAAWDHARTWGHPASVARRAPSGTAL